MLSKLLWLAAFALLVLRPSFLVEPSSMILCVLLETQNRVLQAVGQPVLGGFDGLAEPEWLAGVRQVRVMHCYFISAFLMCCINVVLQSMTASITLFHTSDDRGVAFTTVEAENGQLLRSLSHAPHVIAFSAL